MNMTPNWTGSSATTPCLRQKVWRTSISIYNRPAARHTGRKEKFNDRSLHSAPPGAAHHAKLQALKEVLQSEQGDLHPHYCAETSRGRTTITAGQVG